MAAAPAGARAEATKERILGAAMAEFSTYGIAGARVDRIAKLAECNKNLIYIYFESKEKLFSAVLERSLARVYEELGFSTDDLPGYAARVFDFAMARPDLMRLMAWSALEQKPGAVAERGATYERKVAELKTAQRDGRVDTEFDARFLLTTVMAVATAWSAVSPFGPTLDPGGVDNPAALRRAISDAVAQLARVRVQ